MIFQIRNEEKVNENAPIRLRCPSCHHLGVFRSFGIPAVQIQKDKIRYILTQRACPNADCNAHVFIVFQSGAGKPTVSYPPERIDFDAASIPEMIAKTLEEAITCHAQDCFVAAGIMVRRTLEELCADKGATGKNLQDRIKQLSASVILPQGLLGGLDNLRLLGNDAAHVQSKDFSQVGKDEVEVAIDVTKEVLKAIYQLDDLVAGLEQLKKPKS